MRKSVRWNGGDDGSEAGVIMSMRRSYLGVGIERSRSGGRVWVSVG